MTLLFAPLGVATVIQSLAYFFIKKKKVLKRAVILTLLFAPLGVATVIQVSVFVLLYQ